MHYYPFHVGDYRSSTAHLSNEEDLCYRRLIDLYYDTEAPISLDVDWVARRLRVEPYTVKSVLQDFFIEQEDGWFHERCDEEITKYRRMAEGGRKGAAKRWAKGGDKGAIGRLSPPQCTPNSNQEPITKNQEPKKTLVRPEGVSDSVWFDYLAHRKAKKSPLTQTALNAVVREAEAAGWSIEQALTESMTRGWTGFKASWVKNQPQSNDQSSMFAGGI